MGEACSTRDKCMLQYEIPAPAMVPMCQATAKYTDKRVSLGHMCLQDTEATAETQTEAASRGTNQLGSPTSVGRAARSPNP